MTTRAARRWLWLGSLVAFPAPVLLFGPGRVPPLYLAELGGIALSIVFAESARGNAPHLAAILLAQAAAWALALWLAAWLAALAFAWLGPQALRRATGLLLAVGLGLACALPVYENPFAARTARASLLGIYP
jgi:hypothetical protein